MKSLQETVRNEHENAAVTFLAAIVESSEDAIFGNTLDGIVVSWNKAAEKMYGYTAEEILGKSVFLLAPEDRVDEIKGSLAMHRRGEKVPPYETVRVTKDQRHIDVSVRASVVRDASGAITGIAVIARDITEQKRVQEAFSAANRIKNQFLDNMSHEIRTPLNGILGMTELVLETDLTDEQRENLGLVKISAESLVSAIDDILDFTQIEAGKLTLESIPFDFRESLGETMKMLGFRAQKKGLELAYEVEPEIPRELLGDPGRLRRILYNLVGNAIKFTEHGEILLTVNQESQMVESSRLHFAIKDTGIGIAPEQKNVILQAFTQGDGSSTRRHGGLGLGLTIADRLARLMGGRIWLESEPGKGSTFHFAVTLKNGPEQDSNFDSLNVEALAGMTVLIVDDNSMNRRVLRKMLIQFGMKATDVSKGGAALEALRIARDIGHPFPLIVLDGQMRDTDGFLIAEDIQKDPSMAGATIMMLTSVGHVGEAARCRDLGIAAYLVKPIRPSELAGAICLALHKTAGTECTPLVTRHSLREAKTRLPHKT